MIPAVHESFCWQTLMLPFSIGSRIRQRIWPCKMWDLIIRPIIGDVEVIADYIITIGLVNIYISSWQLSKGSSGIAISDRVKNLTKKLKWLSFRDCRSFEKD